MSHPKKTPLLSKSELDAYVKLVIEHKKAGAKSPINAALIQTKKFNDPRVADIKKEIQEELKFRVERAREAKLQAESMRGAVANELHQPKDAYRDI